MKKLANLFEGFQLSGEVFALLLEQVPHSISVLGHTLTALPTITAHFRPVVVLQSTGKKVTMVLLVPSALHAQTRLYEQGVNEQGVNVCVSVF